MFDRMSRIFSGIQPSGELHIGNYLGAVKNWVQLQHEFESIFCIVDYHAITLTYEPEQLRERRHEMAIGLLAAGIDPNVCRALRAVAGSGTYRAGVDSQHHHAAR